MKKIHFLIGIVISLVVLVQTSLTVGAVGAASFPQNTTAALTQGNFTIVAGSDADTVAVISGALNVTISNGQTFTLRSLDKKNLSNDSGYNYTCGTEYSEIIIVSSTTRTVVITPDSQTCSTASGGGSVGSSSSSSSSSTTTATVTPTPGPTATVTPIPTPTITVTPTTTPQVTVPSLPPNLFSLGLKEGDVIRAAGDPDVYIVNDKGYMRLFLNEKIFSFYAHLGFSKVKNVTPTVRDMFKVSGLFQNCETKDPKVYGVEITGEDVGTLHWVNTTGEKAVADDPMFFKKVFCINTREFNWYPKGNPYTSILQIPKYTRTSGVVAGDSIIARGTIKIIESVSWLNVRASASTAASVIGKAFPGEKFTYLAHIGDWYQIQKDGTTWGWIFGKYVLEI